MTDNLRIALFADSFLEVDGAAMTCRRLVDYAKQRDFPLLCIHAGPETKLVQNGSVSYLSLKRSAVAISIDQDLAYDPLFQRHSKLVRSELERFKPDCLHITGVNDVSIIATLLAWKMQLPLLASWHTNLHEFAGQRLRTLLRIFGRTVAAGIAGTVEKWILAGSVLYYKIPKVILAPNQELVEMLELGTGRTARLMARGVDSGQFSPERRTVDDGIFRFGFVGRLRPEKNVRMLVDLERELIAAGRTNFRFLIVGEGNEREYLEQNLQNADFTGFIDGDELSNAYANMDLFIFPSETDAFGNVVQEATASGVPAIVSDKGGPKFTISDGKDGFVAKTFADFVDRSLELLDNRERLSQLKIAARHNSLSRSWDAIFDGVYSSYSECIREDIAKKQATFSASETVDSPVTLIAVVNDLIGHPVKQVLLRWNWKSAVLSAILRSPIFFTVYYAQKQGLWIAVGAMAVQFVFRTFFGGINGAVLQAFSKIRPAWHAVITVPLFLAAISHIAEFGLQAAYDSYAGSKGKNGAVIVSVSISLISALFNLFAMRRGVLLVKDESGQSLWRDLKQMPSIAFEFVSFPLIWTWRKAKKA